MAITEEVVKVYEPEPVVSYRVDRHNGTDWVPVLDAGLTYGEGSSMAEELACQGIRARLVRVITTSEPEKTYPPKGETNTTERLIKRPERALDEHLIAEEFG